MRLPLWLMLGAAIAGATPYWLDVPEVPAAAIVVWGIAGIVLGVLGRM